MGLKRICAIAMKVALGIAAFLFAYATVQSSTYKISQIISMYSRNSDTSANRFLNRDE